MFCMFSTTKGDLSRVTPATVRVIALLSIKINSFIKININYDEICKNGRNSKK